MAKAITQPPPVEDAILEPDIAAQVATIMRSLRYASRLSRAGIDPPSRILFHGPSGTGKTLTARWMADQMKLPLAVAQLDRVVGMHLGETGHNIAALFREATSCPSVLFLDEIDGMVMNRAAAAAEGPASMELQRSVNVFLQQLDALPDTQIVIAASNIPDTLDVAMRRRFPLELEFALPSDASRRLMLQRWLGKAQKELPEDTIEKMVANSRGLSGAILRAQAMEAAREILISRWDAEPPAPPEMSADETALRADFALHFPGDDWPGYEEAARRCVQASRKQLDLLAPSKKRRRLDAGTAP